MQTKEDILNFCNSAVFCDYKNMKNKVEINQVRNCMINSFYKTIPYTRILASLSLIDDIILKNLSDEIQKILIIVHDLRENILYKLSFEKTANVKKLVFETEFAENNKEFNIEWYIKQTFN